MWKKIGSKLSPKLDTTPYAQGDQRVEHAKESVQKLFANVLPARKKAEIRDQVVERRRKRDTAKITLAIAAESTTGIEHYIKKGVDLNQALNTAKQLADEAQAHGPELQIMQAVEFYATRHPDWWSRDPVERAIFRTKASRWAVQAGETPENLIRIQDYLSNDADAKAMLLEAAQRPEDMEISKLILSGAKGTLDVNCKDEADRTAADIAFGSEHFHLVHDLRKHKDFNIDAMVDEDARFFVTLHNFVDVLKSGSIEKTKAYFPVPVHVLPEYAPDAITEIDTSGLPGVPANVPAQQLVAAALSEVTAAGREDPAAFATLIEAGASPNSKLEGKAIVDIIFDRIGTVRDRFKRQVDVSRTYKLNRGLPIEMTPSDKRQLLNLQNMLDTVVSARTFRPALMGRSISRRNDNMRREIEMGRRPPKYRDQTRKTFTFELDPNRLT